MPAPVVVGTAEGPDEVVRGANMRTAPSRFCWGFSGGSRPRLWGHPAALPSNQRTLIQTPIPVLARYMPSRNASPSTSGAVSNCGGWITHCRAGRGNRCGHSSGRTRRQSNRLGQRDRRPIGPRATSPRSFRRPGLALRRRTVP